MPDAARLRRSAPRSSRTARSWDVAGAVCATRSAQLTDWRAQVRRNEKNLQIAAAAAGFVIAGGIGGTLNALFGRKKKRRK